MKDQKGADRYAGYRRLKFERPADGGEQRRDIAQHEQGGADGIAFGRGCHVSAPPD